MEGLPKIYLFLALLGAAAAKSPPPGSNVLQERKGEAAKEWSLLPKIWSSLDSSFWKSILEGLRPHKDDRRWHGYDVDGFRPRTKRSVEEDSTPSRFAREAAAYRSMRPHFDPRSWNGYDIDGYLPKRRYSRRRFRREIPFSMETRKYLNGWNSLDLKGFWKPESTKYLHEEVQLRSKRSVEDDIEAEGKEGEEVPLSRSARQAPRSRWRPDLDIRVWRGNDVDGFRPSRYYRGRVGREAPFVSALAESPSGTADSGNGDVLESSKLAHPGAEESRSKRSASEPESHSRTVREARSSRPHVDTRMWNGYDVDGFRPSRRYLRRRFGRAAVPTPLSRLEPSELAHLSAEESRSKRSVTEPESHSRVVREARLSRPHVDTRLWNGYDLDGYRPGRRYLRRRAASSPFWRNKYAIYYGGNGQHRRTVRQAYSRLRPHVDTRLWRGHDVDGFRPSRRYLRRRFGRRA